jgi:double-stranded uracil-DNA glycosylase
MHASPRPHECARQVTLCYLATFASEPSPSAVPDVLTPGLDVVFCGINPGRVSAAAAAHFANPRNDFWRLLHAAGLTPRLYAPEEQFALPALGIGLTNVVYRTTKGSGDLRRSDFLGSAERLERIACELRPRAIAFVGKEGYRGAFGERAEHGVQERRLGESLLFVLPSTSPANATVSWRERLRWFQELAGRLTEKPLREGVRAVVVDNNGRTFLVKFVESSGSVCWASPGGGVERGESDATALARELAEECGLRGVELGPLIWVREHRFADMAGWGGQRERHYLVHTQAFEPRPEVDLAAENMHDVRWFSVAELQGVATVPTRLSTLLGDVLDHGPPDEPIDVGV